MKKFINVKVAGIGALALLKLLALFHVFVLLGMIPPETVWAGTAADNITMAESISLGVTIIFWIIIALKYSSILKKTSIKSVNVLVWMIFTYFMINTVANLISPNPIENYVFAPFSIVLGILIIRLALE